MSQLGAEDRGSAYQLKNLRLNLKSQITEHIHTIRLSRRLPGSSESRAKAE